MIDCEIVYNSKLKDAVDVIEKKRKTIAIIIDEKNRVVGTISDGDIRRALLSGYNLESHIKNALNVNPIIARNNQPADYYKTIIIENNLEAVPIVDENGIYIKTIHIEEFEEGFDKDDASGFSFAVIMAGGEGRRLMPFTEKIPKPMIEIGDIPLIELQVKRLIKSGIKEIYISVNYLGHIIEEYLKDGSRFGASIKYLRENKKLGTAGALSLLNSVPEGPILLINGDVLTKIKFGNLLKFHKNYNAKITIASVLHHVQIPYGVISSEGHTVTAIEEKPSQSFLCNAGIYALSHEILAEIPKNEYYDITELIKVYLKKKVGVNVFPVHEYWADIGTPLDLKRVRDEINIKDFANV